MLNYLFVVVLYEGIKENLVFMSFKFSQPLFNHGVRFEFQVTVVVKSFKVQTKLLCLFQGDLIGHGNSEIIN